MTTRSPSLLADDLRNLTLNPALSKELAKLFTDAADALDAKQAALPTAGGEADKLRHQNETLSMAWARVMRMAEHCSRYPGHNHDVRSLLEEILQTPIAKMAVEHENLVRIEDATKIEELERKLRNTGALMAEMREAAHSVGLSLHRAEYAGSVAFSIRRGVCHDKLAHYASMYCEAIHPIMRVLDSPHADLTIKYAVERIEKEFAEHLMTFFVPGSSTDGKIPDAMLQHQSIPGHIMLLMRAAVAAAVAKKPQET